MNKNVNQYACVLVFEEQNREENWMQDSIMFINTINKEHLYAEDASCINT